MPKMPKKIIVQRANTLFQILVDGEEFAYFTMDGVGINVESSETPSITITIPAEVVEVVNQLEGPVYGARTWQTG